MGSLSGPPRRRGSCHAGFGSGGRARRTAGGPLAFPAYWLLVPAPWAPWSSSAWRRRSRRRARRTGDQVGRAPPGAYRRAGCRRHSRSHAIPAHRSDRRAPERRRLRHGPAAARARAPGDRHAAARLRARRQLGPRRARLRRCRGAGRGGDPRLGTRRPDPRVGLLPDQAGLRAAVRAHLPAARQGPARALRRRLHRRPGVRAGERLGARRHRRVPAAEEGRGPHRRGLLHHPRPARPRRRPRRVRRVRRDHAGLQPARLPRAVW